MDTFQSALLFRPYALGTTGSLARLPERPLGYTLRPINADDPAQLLYALRFNVANGLSYDIKGVGMPEWVQLDCAMLPAAFIGWEGPASCLDPALRRQMDENISRKIAERKPALELVGFLPAQTHLEEEEYLPLSEFCALPRWGTTDTIVGYSLFSLKLKPGLAKGLGLKAKALGLAVHQQLGARKQVGIAQYTNSAVKLHARFGPLDLLQVLAPFHTRVGETFIYELTIPDAENLTELLDTGECRNAREYKPTGKVFDLNPLSDKEILRQLDQKHRAGTHRYRIIPPGLDSDNCVKIEERT